ncbi:MAG: M24 family metallopeptidase [Erysipelotrichaceae bacterium]|nr:M24 family metallopeptidase [Erysipelotrichaceae bacterium]
MRNIELTTVKQPAIDHLEGPVFLTDETIEERKQKVLANMAKAGLDKLVVYGDVEHGSNFEYLVGYFTRFEEALLILDKNGEVTLVLGNENLNKAGKSRVKADKTVHVSLFSLPNQPNRKDVCFHDLLVEAGLAKGQRVGIAGWKNFTSPLQDNKHTFDVPYYIVKEILNIVGDESLVTNECAIFIGENGARCTNNANEVAHYEFAASLSSDAIIDAMNAVEIGTSEFTLGDKLVRFGQHTSIVTIATSGPRFIKANMFPTNNTVKLGDPIALTNGYRGGSNSRSGLAIHDESELPENQKDMLDKVAKPYFNAYVAWLENIRCGMEGQQLFNIIEEELPRATYGWTLCPGHLTAEEEWVSSPIYEGSTEKLASGMLLQIDIIPSVSGYNGVNAESTVVLADETLRNDIREQYPDMYARMMARREYLINELGINLSEDVMPMCAAVAYLRPFLLSHDKAFKVVK